MYISIVALIGALPLVFLYYFADITIMISYLFGVLFCAITMWVTYYLPKKRQIFSTYFSKELFQSVASISGMQQFQKKILSQIKEIKDYQIYLFSGDQVIPMVSSLETLDRSHKQELEQILLRSHSRPHIISEATFPFHFPHQKTYAYSYSFPFFNKRLLILVSISSHTMMNPLLQEQIDSVNDIISTSSFMLEIVSGGHSILNLAQESVWDSPYAMGVCNPQGEVLLGNEALYQMFQGDIPNFSNLTGKEVFTLLLDGKKIGQTFSLQGRRVQLEGFPLSNKNFLITRCLFVFFDEQVESKRDLLGEANTLKRFTSGSSVVGAAMFTLDGIILYSNEAFMKSLDVYKVREATQKDIFELFTISPDQYQYIVQQILLGQEQRTTLVGKENEQEFQLLFKGVVFGDKTIIEVVLESEKIYQENVSYLDKETQELYEELKTARSVQEHILTLPTIYRPGIGVNTLYVPSRQLSGDFFTIIPFDQQEQLGILIADVSGHGVSASLITAALKILIEFAPRDAGSLPKIMSYFNTYLAGILPEGSFVTLFYGIIDFQENTLQYINSGHPFPLLQDVDKNEVKILEGMGYPLGGLLNVSFEDLVHTIQLPDRCKILLYTDGVLQHLPGSIKQKLERIGQLIQKNRGINDKELLNTLYQILMTRNSSIPEDDVSMMSVSIDHNKIKKHHLYISSTVLEADSVINHIGDYIRREASLTDTEFWKIHTCFYEALLNAVVHGNKYNTQKKVYIAFRIATNLVVIKIRDEGMGFEVNQVPDPLDTDNILKDFGRGIKMINNLASAVKFNQKGNEITMFFEIHKANK